MFFWLSGMAATRNQMMFPKLSFHFLAFFASVQYSDNLNTVRKIYIGSPELQCPTLFIPVEKERLSCPFQKKELRDSSDWPSLR